MTNDRVMARQGPSFCHLLFVIPSFTHPLFSLERPNDAAPRADRECGPLILAVSFSASQRSGQAGTSWLAPSSSEVAAESPMRYCLLALARAAANCGWSTQSAMVNLRTS